MTSAAQVLDDAFERVGDAVIAVVDGLTTDQLSHRPAADANSVGWLVWHLLRVQDDHVADAAGSEQVWVTEGWHERFGLPFEPSATGYGQTPDDVAAVVTTADLLEGYARAVTVATRGWVVDLTDHDLDRVVDDAWDPPVTLGVRLVSVVEDDLKHVGQAEYLKGLL